MLESSVRNAQRLKGMRVRLTCVILEWEMSLPKFFPIKLPLLCGFPGRVDRSIRDFSTLLFWLPFIPFFFVVEQAGFAFGCSGARFSSIKQLVLDLCPVYTTELSPSSDTEICSILSLLAWEDGLPRLIFSRLLLNSTPSTLFQWMLSLEVLCWCPFLADLFNLSALTLTASSNNSTGLITLSCPAGGSSSTFTWMCLLMLLTVKV